MRLRRLTRTEKEDELVETASFSYENDAHIAKTVEEHEREVAEEYSCKLIIDCGIIADPFQSTFGWLEETSGVRYWPTTGLEKSLIDKYGGVGKTPRIL